jgi:hypothetical protein
MFDKKEQASAPAPSVGLSAEQLQQLLEAVVAAAKKPSEYEQSLIDEKVALRKRNANEALERGKAEMEMKAMRKRNCPHHNGKNHTWVAQAHTPAGEKPYFVPTCQRCNTQLPRVECSVEQITNGINLNNFKTLDMAALEHMAERRKVAV